MKIINAENYFVNIIYFILRFSLLITSFNQDCCEVSRSLHLLTYVKKKIYIYNDIHT